MGRRRKTDRSDTDYYIPTLDEVRAYWSTFEWVDFTPEYFFNHFSGLGWRVGKARIRNWKSTFDSWRSNPIAKSRKESARTARPLSCTSGYRQTQMTAEERRQRLVAAETAIMEQKQREQAEREARLEEDRKNSVSYEEYMALRAARGER